MKKWLRLGAVAGLCASSGWTVDWTALRPQGYVSDFAKVIDPGTKSELENYCGQVERSSGVRILLVTIASLETEPVEDVAKSMFRGWSDIPNPNQDRRVMLLLTVSDRHDWLVTGAGLDPAFTGGLSTKVLRETRLALRQKDYGEALRAAAETFGNAARKAGNPAAPARISRRIRWTVTDSIPWAVVAGGLLMLALMMSSGNPAGYGGLAARGFLPGLLHRNAMNRSTWGSRGSGGFGGFDSGDASGGFGGGAGRDW